jgi:hypothetical protein
MLKENSKPIGVNINFAGSKDYLRSGVRGEYTRTVTFLSNTTAIRTKDMCHYNLIFGSKPKLTEKIKSFEEINIVTTRSNIQGKLKNCGTI